MVASLKGIDAFLNCLPVVNTVNGLIQRACRSQWQASITESSASEASSVKRNFQILVLNKSGGALFFDALPLIGNIVALVKCVIALIHGFENDLEKAAAQGNRDVVLLCLENGDLDNPNKAEKILKNAALSLDNKTFKAILEQGTWNAGHLLNALHNITFQTDNVNSIFDYWNTNKETLNNLVTYSNLWFPGGNYRLGVSPVLIIFLEKNKPELFDRMLELLPKGVISPFGLASIFVHYTFRIHKSSPEEAAILTKEQRNQLIQKSGGANRDSVLKTLKGYCCSTLTTSKVSQEGFLETRFDILTSWIQHTKLETTEAVDLIMHALEQSPSKVFKEKPLVVQFLDNLLTQHQEDIGADVKNSILKVMPDTYGTKAEWAKKWKIALTA